MAPFAMGLPAFMATMSETAVVAMGTAAISTIGVSCYMIFSASAAHKLPGTLSKEWKRATIKYRAAQAQDPISNP